MNYLMGQDHPEQAPWAENTSTDAPAYHGGRGLEERCA